jgi:hypothetical protein
MKNYIYVLSLCTNKKKDRCEFHFNGFYKGHKISRILVRSQVFEVGEEYLFQLSNMSIEDTKLVGECLKHKKLFN